MTYPGIISSDLLNRTVVLHSKNQEGGFRETKGRIALVFVNPDPKNGNKLLYLVELENAHLVECSAEDFEFLWPHNSLQEYYPKHLRQRASQ